MVNKNKIPGSRGSDEINRRISDKPRMSDYNCELMFTRMVRDCLASFIAAYGEERYRQQSRIYFVRDAYRDVLEGIRGNKSAAQCPGFVEWVADHQSTCECIIDREMGIGI